MKGMERRHLSPQFIWVLAGMVEPLPCQWVTVHPSGNEMDTLLPQSTISWAEEEEEKEKCVHEISTEKNACLLQMFLLSPIEDLDSSHPLCSIVSVTVRATRALANMAVVFSCFVMRWRCLEFLLAAPLPLHARNVVLESEIGMKRKSSLPQTAPGGFSPIPRGPKVSPLYFLSIIRSIK